VIVLAIDTCLTACSVAIVKGDDVLAEATEPMTRGHQERLALLTRDVMQTAGLDFCAIDRIGVTVGPGSFTGLRVGLAFAKGLALALDRPCVGVGSLEALAAGLGSDGLRAAAIDAGRGSIFLQVFEGETAIVAPDSLEIETAAARLAELVQTRDLTLTGPGVALLSGAAPGAAIIAQSAPSPVIVAKMAARAPITPPRPMYLRAPDAKPMAA
jgi:tRNA threonylcarbamoyladenosine biosynthesis protein TsaB